MPNISRFLQEGVSIDYTPTSAVSAGNVINTGSVVGVAPADIAAGALGCLTVGGLIRGPFVGGVVANIGDNVWWDADGTPYGGAADGAFTVNAAAGDFWVGTLAAATSATGTTCDIRVGLENPSLPAWTGRTHIASAVDVNPWVAATHSGGVIHITADGKTVTLPTGVVGMEAIIQNDLADAGALVTVDLDGNEIIEGANLTIVATKTALNTKLTAIRGDYLQLICNVAGTSWRCVAKRGIWAQSA